MKVLSHIQPSNKLSASLWAALAFMGFQASAFAAVLPVTSCADDDSPGTLRQVAATALRGDEIDMRQLSCSAITLEHGEVTLQHNVSLRGPANRSLTIVGDGMNRVLNSASIDKPSGYLDVIDLNITGGRVYTKSDEASGGCILANGDVTLTNSGVSDCAVNSMHAGARGGAIYAQGSINMSLSSVTGSSATSSGEYQVARGGGVYASALVCTDSTVSGNSTIAGTPWFDQGGGALIAGGDVKLFRCTVDSNRAGQGGGIMQFAFRDSLPQTTIQNSTISSNVATLESGGMVVQCPDCRPNAINLLNSTVAFNTSSSVYAAAGLSTNGNVVAQSSIVAKNQNTSSNAARARNADLTALSLQGANNLIMSTDAPRDSKAIAVTSDPQLGALSNNGGRTRTHALSATSPALNRGNNTGAFATDQRSGGFARTIAGSTDIGAFQRQGSSVKVRP